MLDMDLTMRMKNKKIDGILLDHEQLRRWRNTLIELPPFSPILLP
jgi:hypothetical protein